MLEQTSLTPSKRNNMSKETHSVENNLKGSQLNNSSLTESDLTNLGNGLDVKGSNELLFYGWPDFGNFEDVDYMLRNCDSAFGLDLDNSDDFSWSFPSSQTIEGSTDILTSSFDFPSCNSPDLETVTRQQEVYGQNSNGLAVNDNHTELTLASYKRDSLKSFSDTHQLGTQLEIHSHTSRSKHQKSSERKRKDRSSENGISLAQFDKLCEAEESNHSSNSQKSLSPENHQQQEISHKSCVVTSMLMIKPNSHPSDQVLPGFIPVIKSEVNVRPSKSPRATSHVLNQRQSLVSSHDVSLKNPSCLENKKKVKSHHSRSSRYTEKCNILVQTADSDILSAKIPIPVSKNDAQGQSEVYGSDIGCPGEKGSSTKQSSSCTSSVLDEISTDACSLKQLQHVKMQLDTRTKLCIRNSLYRLARSAAQRHNCVNPSRAEGESKDPKGALVSNGTNKCTELTDIETDTNPIDRSIAHLLFHRPADPLAVSASVDAKTVNSRTMVEPSPKPLTA